MKRSHGLARCSDHFDEYAKQNPFIQKSFLFVTDGYNFRNTELGAILGLSQLKRLDNFISIRRNAYDKFVNIVNNISDKFYSVKYNSGNSCFCFPFICKTTIIKNKLIALFEKYGIEYRPIVGGNLLKQPYLNMYSIEGNCKEYNVDIVHENGVYIGNNQFITNANMEFLSRILQEL
jgi:CDP-6-deoxy-D-xylo-4-hexulose-3-dehydrase